MSRGSLHAALALLLAANVILAAEPPGLIDEAHFFPIEHPAIRYSNATPTDRIAELQARLTARERRLVFDRQFGYLPAVLEALGIPVSSQMLVFSKTSFQAARISPQAPRALYHSDDVTIGWVRGGGVLEVASVDPNLGAVFYSLDQQPTSRPEFRLHNTDCTGCHQGPATAGVPGLLVRSVYPETSGVLSRTPGFITDHRSPLRERWGGWYVTGEHGSQRHLGNRTFERFAPVANWDLEDSGNRTNLQKFFDTSAYLTPHSDIVALMTLEHQTRMTNLITRVGYETRVALHDTRATRIEDLDPSLQNRIVNTIEEMLRYMLFTDEVRLDAPVRGTTSFAKEFGEAGPRDAKGRSLRDLDLETRLLRYPCSYLIYSAQFNALPQSAKEMIYRRLWKILSGRDESEAFRKLTKTDRQAIREILTATKQDLPSYWRE
jgi:hypothetical protein